MKKALITGINGQDGSYLSELLLEKGYEVWGILKRNSVAENQTARLDDVFNKINLEYADMLDLASLNRVLEQVKPEILKALSGMHSDDYGISFFEEGKDGIKCLVMFDPDKIGFE